jgi:cGMP-dependent protein kinase
METKGSLKDVNNAVTNSNGDRNINNDDSKRKIRKYSHTLKFIQEKDLNEKRSSSKKHYMTKEQRNLLKTYLKENAKENKKTIAKNLVGMFLESNEHNDKIQLKSNIKKPNKKPEIKKIYQTARANPFFKKKIPKMHASKNGSNISLKRIKKLSSCESIRPSSFNQNFKNQKQNKKNNSFNEENDNNKENNNSNNNGSSSNNNAVIQTPKDEGLSNRNIYSEKMNFTSLFRIHQDIYGENNNKALNYSTPRGVVSHKNIVTKVDLDNKKSIIFQSKSFRDFVENSNKKNYDECLKFINTTHILSHLAESDKSLLIQSLKVNNFVKDECIVNAHEKCLNVYFVKDGLLQCVDDDGICIRTLTTGDNFGEKELLMDTNIDYNLITKTDCICYSISVKSFKKMIGHKFRNFIFYNYMKAAFDCSKFFQTMNDFYIEKIFKLFNIINLNQDNVAFPIGHKKSSKFVIIISGYLINSKTKEIIGRPLDILFEEELLSLSDEKIKYALDPSPDALFFEGDTNEILKYLQCKSFEGVLNKNKIFENLSKIVLFKSFSQLKLYKLINLIHKEKYKNEETIIKEGTIGEKFYIVKSGQVEVYQRNIYLRTLNPMEYFGERSLLTNEVRSATVIAKNDVELYCLDKESFNLNLSEMMINYLNISLYLHDETVSLDDLLFIKEIGKGNYGKVSLVMNKRTKFPYAIKVINKNNILNENLSENIQLEKNILLKIDHPFIVKLVKCLKDDQNIYLLLEYIKGKELFDVIRDIGFLNKEQTNFYIASMMVAIQYLHERKIIYRDIKPENIIIEKNGYLKLIDFGTAKEIEDRTKTIIGTPHYMAPEILTGEGYSFQVDFWSISICMYEFICGEVPFGERDEDPMEIYFAIINKSLTFPTEYVTIDKEFKNIMKKMLDKNPSYRLSNFHSIKKQHWFKDFKWDELTNLNLKPPYLPEIPYSSFDFNEQSKPLFDSDKQEFQDYIDYIKENNEHFEIKESFPKEIINEFTKWFNEF